MKGAKKQSGRYRVAGMAKLLTRDLAALAFLQTIPMARQEERLREAMTHRGGETDEEDGFSHSDESEEERREAAAAAAASSWWRIVLAWVGWVWSWATGERGGVHRNRPHGHAGLDRGGDEDDDDDDDDDDGTVGCGHDVWERADPTLTAARRRQRRLKRQLQRQLATQTTHAVTQPLELPAEMMSPSALSSTGRKLVGPLPTTVRMPMALRQGIISSVGQTAKRRQWEADMYSQPHMERSRLFMTCHEGYPILTVSLLRYDPSEEHNRKRRQKLLDSKAGSVFKLAKKDWRGQRFFHLLPAGRARERRERKTLRSLAAGRAHLKPRTRPRNATGGNNGGGEKRRSRGLKHDEDRFDDDEEEEEEEEDFDEEDEDEEEEEDLEEEDALDREYESAFDYDQDGGGDDRGDGPGADGGGCGGGSDKRAPALSVIDDPALGRGRFAQVLKGHDLPLMLTIHKFATAADLKDELNAQWRERNPSQPPSLSLSKIRNLKAEALDGCCKIGVEVATAAHACVYLERLVRQEVVTKGNRRLTMATCLVLAYKFNEPIFLTGTFQDKQLNDQQQLYDINPRHGGPRGAGTAGLGETNKDPRFKRLLDFFENEWSLSPDEVYEAEFGVFVRLRFRLKVGKEDLDGHFGRLLKQPFLNMQAREYLKDEELHRQWSELRHWQHTHGPLFQAPVTTQEALLQKMQQRRQQQQKQHHLRTLFDGATDSEPPSPATPPLPVPHGLPPSLLLSGLSMSSASPDTVASRESEESRPSTTASAWGAPRWRFRRQSAAAQGQGQAAAAAEVAAAERGEVESPGQLHRQATNDGDSSFVENGSSGGEGLE